MTIFLISKFVSKYFKLHTIGNFSFTRNKYRNDFSGQPKDILLHLTHSANTVSHKFIIALIKWCLDFINYRIALDMTVLFLSHDYDACLSGMF